MGRAVHLVVELLRVGQLQLVLHVGVVTHAWGEPTKEQLPELLLVTGEKVGNVGNAFSYFCLGIPSVANKLVKTEPSSLI